MTGFENPLKDDLAGNSAVGSPTETNSEAIEGVLGRANQLRSRQIADWARHCLAEWRSLWRRPGRAVTKAYRSSKANA